MEILIILIAYILIYFIWQRQKKLLEKINKIDTDSLKTSLDACTTPMNNKAIDKKEEDRENLLRYRMRIYLLPNWEDLIKEFSRRNNISYDDYLGHFTNNKNLKVNFKESLFCEHEGFSFAVFNDKGMEQIWSEYSNKFVDEIEIYGQMFSCEISDQRKLNESPYKQAIKYLVANPTQFGFAHWARGVDQEGIFAEIPFDKIVSFFENLYRNEGNWACKCAIKTFSKELVNELNKYNVTYNKSFIEDYGVGCSEKDFNYKNLELYSDWAKNNNIEVYEQVLKFHQFETEYYSVLINIEFYN